MPKQASIMSPTRNQNAIESAYEMMYKKRILRRQMLRLKMLEEQKYEKKTIQTQSVTSKRISTLKLNSVLSVVAKKTSPLLLRTCKPITSPNAKPINIAITFNATSKNIEREFKTFEINAVKQESPVMQEKARKQWPKLVCSMEISPITSNDFILNGAVLPSETNFSFSPPKPPPPHSPKVPITAPPTSSPPPFVSPNCAKGTNLLHSTTTTQGADNLLAPKKRRFVLSDRPPPMFKTPLKDPYKADYKSVPFADLRRKITGSMPELRRETLKMREDDCISIFAQTDIITDDDLIINVDRPDITPIISATKKAEIQNWVAQASSPSTTSFESDTNAPQFSSTSSSSTDKFPDSPESIHCPSINENTTLYRRFDRFQLSFNSEESESSRTESSNVATPPVPDENIQHSFKMPYSVMAKSSIVSPYSSAQLITANSRNSSDFPSSVSEYDCESAVVIPESQRRAQEVVRFDSPKDIQNASNCNISPSNPTSPVPYFQRNVDILNASMNQPIIDEIKRSPPTEKMGKTVNNSLNQSIRASNQQKSNPNTFNNSKGKLTIETSNQKSAHVIKTTVSYEKPVEQTTKTPDPLNHFQFKKPPPNIPPNQLNAARNTQFNNTPPKNAANQNHSPHIFAPNDLMNYLTRPPVAPFNGPPIRGQFRSVHPYQRPSAPKCPQRFPGPRYMRMNNVHPQPQVDYRQMRPSENNILKAAQLGSPNLPPPTRNFAVQVRPNVWQQQNWYQSDERMRTAQNHSLQLSQIQAVLCNFCTWHYREGSCRFGPECKKYHQCPQEVAQSMTLLQPKEIQKIVLKLCAEKLHSVICELLDVFLRTYVRNNNVTAILDLVQPVLEVSFFSYSKMQSILSALCQLGMNYKSAILKVLYYVGASNRKLVDILFAIITDHCDPTTSSTITSHWSAIEQLLESATQLDHGVFADLCAKSLAQHTTNADHVAMLIALGRVLTAEPCKVDVQRMDQMLLVRLCERLEAVDAGGGGLGGLMRSRLLIGWTGNGVMDREGGMLEDRTISSTIPGLSNTHFISVPLQIQNSTIAAHAKNKSSATNTDRNRNNCSPDSSSYAAATDNNHPSTPHKTFTPSISSAQTFHTPPIPSASPVNPLLNQSAHFSTQILDQSIIAHHQSLSPSTTFYNLTDCHSLYSCITKYQYNNASVLIAKERESAIEPICKMIHSKTVLVSTAFAFFDVLWDHTEEHFLQFIEIKRVILYILFNIYEFLWKERCFSDAASLITTKFSNEKESFLYYKTFLPSGQCSPMQKCHRVIKLLLQEKILQPAYDWFIREEYHSTDITSDLNVLTNEKNCLIEEFLLLSYRDLDIAFNLVIFCMNRHLGDFKHHYNCILMQMINSTDHKEKVIALRERLYNDQYVYTNAQTLRSYVVEFFSHLTLNELLHIYDIISRDNVYPKLTGHEHIVTMRDTLKESEVTLILMNFLHQIVQNRIDVTWDVKIQFQTAPVTGPTMPDARSESIVYPRNLLMCSTPTDAVKRLVNVLRSFNLMLSNPADAHKWQACHTSGTVTLYKGHVQAMVRNYRGTQTFT